MLLCNVCINHGYVYLVFNTQNEMPVREWLFIASVT